MTGSVFGRAITATALLLAVSGAGSAAAQTAEQPDCQRECLESYVDRYLQAMADGTVSDELFARNIRFTENGIEMPFGNEGLWATTSRVGNYKLYVPDVETQQVAFLGTVFEQASSSATGPQREPEPVGLSLRLRIDSDGKISEVEQIAARPERALGDNAEPPAGPFSATGKAVEAMGSPAGDFDETIPEDERHSRAELVEMANHYFEAVERNTGKDYYPFTDDCIRYENGMVTAGPPDEEHPDRLGCRAQLQNTLIGAVTSIRDRRIVAVDRERGIVFAFGFFDHRPINWTWQLGELFKVEKGLISRIEAIFIRGPYGVCSGWSTYEQCRSEEPQDIR